MMRVRILAGVLGCCAVLAPGSSFAEDPHPGRDVYQRCAACHLPNGAGVPGAFPPLRENLSALASTEKGRAYLTYVILKGVSGEIKVGGQTYRGVMPTVAAGLSDEEISHLLNYLISNIAPAGEDAAAIDKDAKAEAEAEAEAEAFSPEEVKRRRAAVISAHTQQSILTIRAEALKEAASPSDVGEGEQ